MSVEVFLFLICVVALISLKIYILTPQSATQLLYHHDNAAGHLPHKDCGSEGVQCDKENMAW